MEIDTPEQHPPPSPGPVLPLAGKTLAELTELGRTRVRRLRGHAEDLVLFGQVLAHARDAGLCQEDELYPWIHREFGIEKKQADKYLAVSVLPPELVRGEMIDLDKLVEIARLPAPLWAVATAAGRGADAEHMKRARGSVAACLATLRNLPETARMEQAAAHLRGVLDDKRRLFRGREDKPPAAPAVVARDIQRKLAGSLVHLADLKARGLRGRALETGWAGDLWDAASQVLLAVAEVLGRDPHELLGAGAARPREDLTEKSRENETSPSEIAPLGAGEKSAGESPLDEPWYVPLARALAAAATADEQPVLARHLLMALSGGPPAELVAMCSDFAGRIEDPAIQADLAWWLRQAARPELERRWPYIYNVFTSAQLPGFRHHLHLLQGAALPAPLREQVAAACAYWVEDPGDPPLPRPDEDAGPGARLRWLDDLLRRAQEGWEAFPVQAPVSVLPLGWIFGESLELTFDLDGLRHLLLRQLGLPPGPEDAPLPPL